MKQATSVFLIVLVLLTFAGAAFGEESSGVVTAVDAAKGTLTLKTGTVAESFDCETGSLIKEVKVGDKITVEYQEKGGKKITIKVSPTKKESHVGC